MILLFSQNLISYRVLLLYMKGLVHRGHEALAYTNKFAFTNISEQMTSWFCKKRSFLFCEKDARCIFVEKVVPYIHGYFVELTV